MRVFWLLLFGLLLPRLALAQARLNLNFEPEANRRQPLLLWFWSSRGTDARNDARLRRIDTLTRAASGRGSLLLDLSRTEEPIGGALYTTLAPIDSLRGHTITISGQLRTAGFTGKAFLYAHAQAGAVPENLASHDNFATPVLPVTAEWQRVQIQLPVPAAATRLLLGLRVQGQGKVWLDDVQITWGPNQRYHDQLLPGTEPLLLSAAARRANWDFERPLPLLPDPRYRARPDSLTPAAQGRRSLQLTAAAGALRPFAYLGQLVLDSALRGKTLVVEGHLRGTDLPTSLAYSILHEDNRFGSRYSSAEAVREVPLELAGPAVAGWQPFRAAIPVTWNGFANQLALGLRLGSAAPVGVDALRLLVDGKPYAPPADPAAISLPTPAELAWLRQAAQPLRTALPDGGDTKDLAAFGALVGSAQVVGLGEATPGTRETTQLRHRLVRYLIEQKGVRTLALEADAGACLALNAYLQTGQGNPRQLLQALGPVASAETLALVQWLRAYNDRAPTKVQVWGLECQRPETAVAWLQELLPERATALRAQLARVGQLLQELPRAELRVNPLAPTSLPDARLTAARTALAELRTTLLDRTRLLHALMLPNADLQQHLLGLLEQYLTQHTLDPELAPAYRAHTLAASLHWLQGQAAGGRLVVLAPNQVVAGSGGTGQLLRATYGAGYVAVGATFAGGSFRGGTGLGSGPILAATPAEAGSYEYYFQAAKTPLAWLNLRTPALTPGTQWLYQNLLLRDAAPPYAQFSRHNLRREFDALLFVPAATPTRPLTTD